jgi:hypothetical protein
MESGTRRKLSVQELGNVKLVWNALTWCREGCFDCRHTKESRMNDEIDDRLSGLILRARQCH